MVFALAALASISFAGPGHNLPLDRPHSQQNVEPFLIEKNHIRQIGSSRPLAFALPRPCADGGDTAACFAGGRFRHFSADGSESLVFQPMLAEEFGQSDDASWQTEAGGVVTGHKGLVSFQVDGRMFVRNGTDGDSTAPDGEPFDSQDGDVTGSIGYASYVRYRGNLALDLPFGRFVAARDALHWGPGLYSNLTFNQAAIPFHHLTFSTTVGRLSVATLYGDLQIGRARPLDGEKSLYGRRYEWRLMRDVTLGISEQLILGGGNKPFLFVPIFPLFMAKGFLSEDDNNGNIAFDAAWRIPGRALLYSEFLIDDMESPSSLLFKNYNQNKWGWMIGGHAVAKAGGADVGAVVEYARLQPWVYSHFAGSDAQSTNLGRPLGNPDGPDSQRASAKFYGRFGGRYYAGLLLSFLWKGSGAGADAYDPYEGATYLDRNAFLDGADAEFAVTPHVQASWGPLSAEAAADLGADAAFRGRVGVAW